MPVSRVLILLALFASCLAIVGLAWASGSELYTFFPGRHVHRPPTHPIALLIVLAFCMVLTLWIGQRGIYVFMIATVGILLGSGLGFFVYDWTPTWSQHLLSIAMIGTCIYGWMQRDYFEE